MLPRTLFAQAKVLMLFLTMSNTEGPVCFLYIKKGERLWEVHLLLPQISDLLIITFSIPHLLCFVSKVHTLCCFYFAHYPLQLIMHRVTHTNLCSYNATSVTRQMGIIMNSVCKTENALTCPCTYHRKY